MAEPPFEVHLSEAALIVVDMQNDFVRADAPMHVPDAIVTVPVIQRLVAWFRESGRPIVFTRFLAGPGETDLWKWSPALRDPVRCCRPGHVRSYGDVDGERQCADIIDELTPLPGEAVVDKYRYGAFERTNLADILAVYQVSTVLIAGTVTQICVDETARGAFDLGFRTVLIRDAVSSFDAALHEATLRNFEMKFGRVMDSAAVVGDASAAVQATRSVVPAP